MYKGDAICTEVIPPALTVVPLKGIGLQRGYIGVILGGYMRIMEKKMETTIFRLKF